MNNLEKLLERSNLLKECDPTVLDCVDCWYRSKTFKIKDQIIREMYEALKTIQRADYVNEFEDGEIVKTLYSDAIATKALEKIDNLAADVLE